MEPLSTEVLTQTDSQLEAAPSDKKYKAFMAGSFAAGAIVAGGLVWKYKKNAVFAIVAGLLAGGAAMLGAAAVHDKSLK